MPNRIIKESICTSDTIDLLSAEEERFFYRLIVQADDFGRFDGRAPVVLAGTFPLRSHEIGLDRVESWLERLAAVDLIRFYYVDGRRYLYFTTWDKHQQKRAKHSKYPDPTLNDNTGDRIQSTESERIHMKSSDITCNQEESDASVCPREARSENTRSEKRDARAGEDESPDPNDKSEKSEQTDNSLTHSSGMSVVTTHYHNRIGMLGPTQYHKLSFWHDEKGMEADVICRAIDTTVEQAERPGLNYIEGVLRNWYNEGLRTMADFDARASPTDDDDIPSGLSNALKSAYARLEEAGEELDTA